MSSVSASPALESARLTAKNVELTELLRIERKARLEERAMIEDQREQIITLQASYDALESKLEELLASSSYNVPRADPGQLNLFEDIGPKESAQLPSFEELREDVASTPDAELAEDGAAERKKRSGKRKASRRSIDESNLRREVVRHELPEGDRICPQTGVSLVETSVKVTTELDYRSAELIIIENHQVVYGAAPEVAQDRQIATLRAPAPIPAVEGVRAGSALLAWLIYQKYVLHLPLYRQEGAFKQLGVSIARQTLCDWVLKVAFALRPIAREIERQIRAGPVMQLDDTPIKCMIEGENSKRRKLRQAYLWVFTNPTVKGVVFRFTPGRSTKAVAPLLKGVTAEVFVGDGLATNRSAAREAGLDVEYAGCWAHVLRKFRDATAEAPARVALFRDDFKTIYAVEEKAAAENLNAEEIRELRQKVSGPAIIAMLRRTSGWKRDYSLRGKMAEAITFLRNQRRTLLVYLKDGRVPIDNNACERAIRPVAIGRNNWMFTGSVEGGEAAATLYTVIESAKAAGMQPLDYMTAALDRVGTHPSGRIAELVPEAMMAELDRAAG